MLDVHFPTTDGRMLILSRYTELNADQKLLLKQLKLDLPPQPLPIDFARLFPRVEKVGLATRRNGLPRIPRTRPIEN